MSSQPSPSNRSRKGVATQACETCRRRKSKCDEKRPQCTLCQRLNLDCIYKEASETKKDDGVERVIDVLQRIELKVDDISASSRVIQMQTAPGGSMAIDPQHIAFSGLSVEQIRSEQDDREAHPEDHSTQIRPYLTIPHKIILWPRIYSQLVSMNPEMEPELRAMFEGGTPWLVRQDIERQGQGLRHDVRLSHNTASRPAIVQSALFLPFTTEYIWRCVDAYFGTFNALYPILDYGDFRTETLQPLISAGFEYGNSSSVLALLVLALGSLAAATITGERTYVQIEPLDADRSDAVQDPPGLHLFNEARARMGSIWFKCDLSSVQVQLLFATYFAANGCHVEYWHSTVSASMVCQVLASPVGVAWHTLRGDAIKRAYWTCVINEDLYHLDLDLPRSSISQLEDHVPLPHFNEPQNRGNAATREETGALEALPQYFFFAKASLKRMISRIHEAIHLHSNQSESLDSYRDPPIHVTRELSHQLESWRALLPVQLQWLDDETREFEAARQVVDLAGDFTEVAGQVGLEVMTAELRSRFYYARHILFRPFIFKALHFPQLMNAQDEEYCAYAIGAACLWSVTMASTRSKKPLIPHLFSWTQNFIALLLILWVSRSDPCLRKICIERLDPRLMESSSSLMLEWLTDMERVDGIAKWSLRLLTPLFANRT